MRRLRNSLMAALVLGCGAPAALAVEPDETLADQALETRARAISRLLRCVVCQSESIDDSGAPLARDLRLIVRERVAAGDTDAEVLAFVADRYGDYVLLKPRLTASTVLLWSAPALFVGGAAAFGVAYWRRRGAGSVQGLAPLTPTEQEALDRLITDPQDRP